MDFSFERNVNNDIVRLTLRTEENSKNKVGYIRYLIKDCIDLVIKFKSIYVAFTSIISIIK